MSKKGVFLSSYPMTMGNDGHFQSMDTNSPIFCKAALFDSRRLLECVLFNPLFIFIFGRCLIHSNKAEESLQNLFTAWTCAMETHAVLLLQDHLAIWALENRPLRSSSKLIACCICHQPLRRHSTVNYCWNSAGQTCPEVADVFAGEGEQTCGLRCWGHSGVPPLWLRISQEFNCDSDRHIHVSFSTAIAGCQWGHGDLSWRGFAVILYLNLMNLLIQSYCVQTKATRQRACVLEGQFNHCYLFVV